MQIINILVTGSNGMVGTRLCQKLSEKNYNIFGADRKENLWNVNQDKSRTINLDLRDKSKVLELLPTDIDLIIHLAGHARVHNSVIDPSIALDNFIVTYNIMEFARLNRIKNLMFSSSREVYGNSAEPMHTEDDVSIESCESPYTASKLASEALIWSYHRCYGLDFIIFRLSNVYGMYDNSDRVIPQFVRNAAKGEDLIIFGKDKCMDFTYIDDTVQGIIKGIERFDNAKDSVFNIATGKAVSISYVAELIKSNLNSNSEIIFKENKTGEVVKYIANISKAKSVLNYEPMTGIEKGISKTITWYTSNSYTRDNSSGDGSSNTLHKLDGNSD
jgi:nucleoside-diphosphate-sugar epimerase